MISRGVIIGFPANRLSTIIPAYDAVPKASLGDAYLVGFYGGDEALVVEPVLVELG
jgi:hypothetical protein